MGHEYIYSKTGGKNVRRFRARFPLWGVKGASADPLVGTSLAPAVMVVHLFLTDLGQNSWRVIKLLVALGIGSTNALLRCTRRTSGVDLGFPWAHQLWGICHVSNTLGRGKKILELLLTYFHEKDKK